MNINLLLNWACPCRDQQHSQWGAHLEFSPGFVKVPIFEWSKWGSQIFKTKCPQWSELPKCPLVHTNWKYRPTCIPGTGSQADLTTQVSQLVTSSSWQIVKCVLFICLECKNYWLNLLSVPGMAIDPIHMCFLLKVWPRTRATQRRHKQTFSIWALSPSTQHPALFPGGKGKVLSTVIVLSRLGWGFFGRLFKNFKKKL